MIRMGLWFSRLGLGLALLAIGFAGVGIALGAAGSPPAVTGPVTMAADAADPERLLREITVPLHSAISILAALDALVQTVRQARRPPSGSGRDGPSGPTTLPG